MITKYQDTVPMTQIYLHPQFTADMCLKIKMPITSSMYVHDSFYETKTFEKNSDLIEKCPPGFLGAFLNEFKRFSKQFIS